MNTRRIILFGLLALILVGLGNFIYNSALTRSQLSQVASSQPQTQEEGVRRLMARGVLFDALQGGAPPKTRLQAIAALTRMAEGGKNPDAFKQLLQMLKDPDTESAEQKTHPVRDAAKDAVAKVGTGYPDLLLDAAKDADNNIRDQSRNALKQIGAPMEKEMAARLGDNALRAPLGDILSSIGPETIPLIAPYLAADKLPPADKPDDVATAKIQLIETLGKFHEREAAVPIIPFKNDENPNVRRSVVTSLANIADPVGASVLIEALQDPNADASARAAAAGALGAIATPEANAAMVTALTDYDTSIANAAAAGLRRAGDRAASAIAQALANPDPAVRERAAEATGGMRTIGLAVRALSDPDPTVRATAAESLGDILTRAHMIRSDLARLAAAPDTDARYAMVQSLQTRGGLMEVLQPSAPPAAKANAIAALQAKADAESDDGKKKPFASVRDKLTDPAAVTAEAAMPPLANPSDPNALAPLLAHLNDPEGAVAANASQALGRIGQPAVPALIARLSSPDDTLAYYASLALESVGRNAVDSLLPVAQPGNPGARWAAITLGEIGDSRAAPALETLKKSPDADTAFAAGTALAKVREG